MFRCCPAAPEPQRSSTSKTSAMPKPQSWSATTTTGQDATPPRKNGSGSPFNNHPHPEIQYRMKTSCGTPLCHCHTSNFSLPTTAARSHRQARTLSKFTPPHHAAAATKKSLHVWHPRSWPSVCSTTPVHVIEAHYSHELAWKLQLAASAELAGAILIARLGKSTHSSHRTTASPPRLRPSANQGPIDDLCASARPATFKDERNGLRLPQHNSKRSNPDVRANTALEDGRHTAVTSTMPTIRVRVLSLRTLAAIFLRAPLPVFLERGSLPGPAKSLFQHHGSAPPC